MSQYRLLKISEADLDDIWKYTCETWEFGKPVNIFVN